MKLEFWCDNGANIHSRRKDLFDTDADFGMSDEEWNEMSDEKKHEYVKDWALERFDYGFEEK